MMSNPQSHTALELFAWVGEDELGSGEIGLKQAVVPAGRVALVATRQDKMMGSQIPQQLQQQATNHGKTIRLCRFVFVEELVTLEPKK